MPLDASILLGAKGIATPDPLAMATHALTLGNLALGNKESMLKLDTMQRQQATTDALNRVLPGIMQSNWSPEAVQAAIQAEPSVAGTLLDAVDKKRKADADINLNTAHAADFTAKANKTKLEPFTNMAYSLANDPNLTPDKVAAFAKSVGDAGLTNLLPVPKFQDWNNPDAARQNLKLMGTAFFDAEKQASQAETGRHNVTTERQAADTLAETNRYHTGELGVQRGNLAVAQQNSATQRMTADPFGQLEALRKQPGFGAPAAAGAPGGDATAGGDAALAGMPPQMAAQVKALAEGRMAFPSGFALKSPYWQNMLSAVAAYDPSFDAVNYNARSKTRNSFVAGPDANNINALNTAMGHADNLSSSLAALNNTGSPMINRPLNAIQDAVLGDPRQTKVNEDINALSSEMAKVFRSTGMSVADIDHWRSTLSQNMSPDQQKAAVGEALSLMGSRLDALGVKYDQGMGTTGNPLKLLSPKAQEIYNRLGSDGGGKKATAPTTSASGTSVTAPDGKTYTFPSESAALEFKTRAGIR